MQKLIHKSNSSKLASQNKNKNRKNKITSTKIRVRQSQLEFINSNQYLIMTNAPYF